MTRSSTAFSQPIAGISAVKISSNVNAALRVEIAADAVFFGHAISVINGGIVYLRKSETEMVSGGRRVVNAFGGTMSVGSALSRSITWSAMLSNEFVDGERVEKHAMAMPARPVPHGIDKRSPAQIY
jgi:hypothetical protein